METKTCVCVGPGARNLGCKVHGGEAPLYLDPTASGTAAPDFKALAQELHSALDRIEWVSKADGVRCPRCDGPRRLAHKPGCILRAALDAAEAMFR